MRVRSARPSDEPAMAAVCARAFFNESFLGNVLHPRRHEYPQDVNIFWHEWIRREWANQRSKVFVATITDEHEHEKVVGVAIWERKGDDKGAQRVMKEWVDPGAFPVLERTESRAIDYAKMDLVAQSMQYAERYWKGPNAFNWYLDLCCVDPDHERRGYGRQLVRKGLDRAEEEGVKASVISTFGSDPFYIKCGYHEVVGCAIDGADNPLKDEKVQGGNVLFMWEKDRQVSAETRTP
ncbi:hypothetical protein NX059_011490 [Plenodomus lindquistii]|nr:hypothetical protein NX059_011490 [Plenodomus lindquistii]